MAISAPREVNVTPTDDGYLKVTWIENDPSESVNKYLIYRGTEPGFAPVETSLIGQVNDPPFIDMNITGSTYYYYKVTAVDSTNTEGPPSAPQRGKGALDRIVEDITVGCIVGISILLLFFVLYDGLIFDKDGYVMSFNGNPTFADDKISAIMNNTLTNRMVTIYGVKSSIELSVHTSNLTNNDADVVIPLTASLTKLSEPAKIKSGNATRIVLTLNNSEIKAGSFDGLLTLQENEFHSIPVRLDTQSMLIQSITIVGIGILISIILWELIKYFRKNNAEQERQLLLDRSRESLNNATLYQESSERLQERAGGINLRADERNQLEKDAELRKSMANFSRIAAETNRERAAVSAQQVERYKVRSLHRGTTYGKIIAIELGSALFGMTLGLFGLLTNDYVMGLRSLGAVEVAVLIGLGLGIGSLKEFVDK